MYPWTLLVIVFFFFLESNHFIEGLRGKIEKLGGQWHPMSFSEPSAQLFSGSASHCWKKIEKMRTSVDIYWTSIICSLLWGKKSHKKWLCLLYSKLTWVINCPNKCSFGYFNVSLVYQGNYQPKKMGLHSHNTCLVSTYCIRY